jgi:Leucine-rich repeat (LRR) protein
LYNLYLLNISTNQIKKLPDEFGNLSMLNKLWVQDNKLITYPESMVHCYHLDFIHDDGNRIDIFEMSEKLRTIYKHIKIFREHPFKKQYLEILSIENHIKL